MTLKNTEIARSDKKREVGPELPGKNRILFFIVCVGLLIIIAISAVYIPKIGDKALIEKIELIDNRLRKIEDRINRIEDTEKRISLLDEQRTKFEISLMNRLDSLEALVSLRSEAGIDKQDTLHREAVLKTSAKKTDLEEDSQKEKKVPYHTVRPGETLYRISLKYDITVEELRRLNKIGPEAVIYIGQKLILNRDKKPLR